MIKWNGLEKFGFAPISRSFLQNYRLLNISMEEAMLVLHLLDHIWLGRNEFPTAKLFASKTGKSENTVRAYFKSLRFKGFLLAKVDSTDKRNITYDYRPLMDAIISVSGYTPEETTSEEVVEKQPTSELERIVQVNNELAKDKRHTRVPVTTKPSHWKRVRSFVEKDISKYNAKDIELLFASEWKNKSWDTPPPRFYAKDLKHAKELIKVYGASNVVKVISTAIQDWEKIAPKFNINSYPSMAIMWGFRASIFPTIIDGDIAQNNPAWGSHYEGHQTKEGEEIGWNI